MKIIVLGAAAGGGYPQWNCNCAVCALAWTGDPRVKPRTQSSLAVTGDDEGWFLLNASPDLRQQIASTPALHPAASARHSPIAGAVLTNADVDHIGGLVNLRESQALRLYATATVLQTLAANTIFNVLNTDFVERRVLDLDHAVPLAAPGAATAALTVEAFAVPGKVPLYLEGLDENRREDTVALKVCDGAGNEFFYIPGCADVTSALAERLDGARLVFFDGTLWRDEEMISAGVGKKTGRRMGHISLDGPDGTLARFAGIDVKRKILIHINNTNPILIAGSPEARAVEAAGWEIGYDGMAVEL